MCIDIYTYVDIYIELHVYIYIEIYMLTNVTPASLCLRPAPYEPPDTNP